ncbi:hypothetical protein [Listeria rustica]|uniref:Uncharacterized protein n=1 Tax=Listeria rustica TaxID=2713503 RepID=A0A7W1YGE4_9LIST|nr:hypothetical protein [Listeria rustica]MBA3926538.1 hypothetical protein [Listeria rustica]
MTETKNAVTKKDIEAAQTAQAISKDEKHPMRKYGKQETHTVEGVDYTFQFPGVRHTQQIIDSAKLPGGVFGETNYNTAIMSDVIISPKVDWDYWEEHDGYGEVMALADNFLGRTLG